ncbi:quinate permease [Moesziomyces antarcticus]|uniref:Quinate transporter n=2 Tax=Pseudozyma antarctica TaxID=84753 RepID=A0A081CKJ6_PSEA2|nr:quinate permease [Moesziomyces antarcticus]GAK67192.1 quinate permease [Moesziomyces antarcticus]SPO48201.1 probable quinate permease [Moesziomyces antarcticus]
MGFLKRVEDRPTPSAVYNWRVWVLSFIASFASIMIGYDSAFVGGTIALPSFLKSFGKLSNNTSGNLVSTYQAGAFFGAFLGHPLGHFWGRKKGLFVCSVVFTIGAAIMTAASPSTHLTPIYVGRAIAGIAIGAASNLTPIYISEIAPAPARGQAIGIYEIGWQIGGIVGFFINYGVIQTLPPSVKQWRIPFAVQLIPGGMFMIGTFFLVESPRWLLQRGRVEEAREKLSYIRHLPVDHPYFVEEFNEMHAAIDETRRAAGGDSYFAPFKYLFSRKHLVRRLAFASSLFLFQNGTGINAINYYSPTVFKSIGITGTSTGLLTTGIFGIIKTTGAALFILILVETVGRRRLLMTSSTGGALAMYYIAGYIAIAKPAQHKKSSLDAGGTSALVFFYIWTCFYSFGYNPIPWVYGAESFDNTARPVAQIFNAASNWLYNFVISQATPHMFAKMDYGVYLFFATMMVIGTVYIYLFMPETKGIPIEEMDNLHEKRPQRHAHRMVLEELRTRAAERRGEAVLADQAESRDDASSADEKEANQVKLSTA